MAKTENNKLSTNSQRKIGFVVSWVQILISTLSGLLFTPFLISSLGQTEYGLYQLLYSTIGYIATLDLGLGGTITRYVIKYDSVGDIEKRNSVVGMCIKIYSVISLIAFFAVAIVAFYLDKLYVSTIDSGNIQHARVLFMFMGITACLSLFDHAFTGILTAYEKYIVTKGLRAIKDIVRIFVLVIMFMLGYDALAIVVVDFIAMLIIVFTDMMTCILSTPIKKFRGKFDKPLFKEIMIYSAFVFMQVIVNQFNTSLDRVLLGRYSTLVLVGMYGVAMQVYNMANSIGGVFGGLTLPMITRCVCEGNSDEIITNECIRYSRMQCYILLPILSGFALFGQDFIQIWMGDTYNVINLWVVALIIIAPNILEWIETPIFNVMKAKNMQATRSILLIFVLVFNLILSVILIQKFPIYGTAVGTMLSCIIGNNILSNIYYHKKIGVNMCVFFKGIFKGILPAWLVTFAVGLALNYVFKEGVLAFLIKGCIYVAVYAALMYCFGVNSEEKTRVNNAIHAITNRIHKNR